MNPQILNKIMPSENVTNAENNKTSSKAVLNSKNIFNRDRQDEKDKKKRWSVWIQILDILNILVNIILFNMFESLSASLRLCVKTEIFDRMNMIYRIGWNFNMFEPKSRWFAWSREILFPRAKSPSQQSLKGEVSPDSRRYIAHIIARLPPNE